MKRILSISVFLILCFASFGQNGNWQQTNLPGTVNSVSQAPGAVRGNLGVISGSFADTGSANNGRTNSVAGTQIWNTTTKSYWFWNGNRWIEISPVTANCQSSLIGSATWSGVGLGYDVTNLTYNLPTNYCLFYNTLATTLTDAPADPTFDRIDYIVADINQDVYFVNGTAGSGVPPSINPLTQRIIAQVNVPAGSTTPDPTINIVHLIYDENVPPEWAGSSNVSGVDFAATSPTPCYGTVSTKVPNPTNGKYVEWQNPYGATDISNGQYLKFRIKLSGAPTTGSTLLSIGFYNVATQSTQIFPVANGSYGLDYNSTACQSIVIPIVAPFNSTTADRVIFTFSGASGITVTLDRVYLLEGANPPPSASGINWIVGGNFLNGIRPAWLGSLDKSEISLVTEGKERLSFLADSIPVSIDTADFILVIPSVGKPYLKKIHQPSIYALGCLKIYDSTSSGITRKYIRDTCSGGGGSFALTNGSGTTVSGSTTSLDLGGALTEDALWTTLGGKYLFINGGKLDFDNANSNTYVNGGTGNTSTYLTAVGIGSGDGNATIYNTFIGAYAGESNTGKEVTAMGIATAQQNTADSVTAIGNYAGNQNTGKRSLFLGINAGINGFVFNSFNDVIALGNKSFANANNQLAISDSIHEIKSKITGYNTAGYVLTTDGSGIATFQPAGGGGGEDLDATLALGNVSPRSIFLNNDTSSFSVQNTTGIQNVVLSTDGASAGSGKISLLNSDGYTATITASGMNDNATLTIPRTSGFATVSVNGVASDIAGSISLTPTSGATGQTSYTTGDILYASASNTLLKLGIGSSKQALRVVSGVPAWRDTAALTLANLGGLGTGIATALAVNTGSAGAPVLFNGAGGTPSSLTLTNATGLPIAGTTGYGTGVATALAVATNAIGGMLTGASSFSANVLTVLSDFRPTKTITAAGTTGAQTINKTTGTVNFAAGATTLVVTNSFATANSVVIVTVYGTDATATSARVTKASGSFTITLNAAATAETAVGFMVTN